MMSCAAALLALGLSATPDAELATAAAPTASTPPAANAAVPPAKPPVNPLSQAIRARTPEEQAAQSGFQLALGVDHSLGLGTFVDPSRYALVVANLTVAPTYLFSLGDQRLAVSAALRAGLEYTLPDAETGRRVTVGDLRLGLSAPALVRDRAVTGLSLTPAASLTFPTSPESWNARLVTALGLSLTVSRSVGPLDLRLAVGGTRGFFASPQTGMRATDARDANGNLLAVCRPDEALCGFSSWNTEWSLSLGGQVAWRATGSLLVYAGYTFVKAWKHPATLTPDELTPKALDTAGNPVACVGLCQADRTQAFLGASYQLDAHYALDLGLSTAQAPLTDDGKQVRFPWLSIGAWASNRSTISLSLSAAY